MFTVQEYLLKKEINAVSAVNMSQNVKLRGYVMILHSPLS